MLGFYCGFYVQGERHRFGSCSRSYFSCHRLRHLMECVCHRGGRHPRTNSGGCSCHLCRNGNHSGDMDLRCRRSSRNYSSDLSLSHLRLRRSSGGSGSRHFNVRRHHFLGLSCTQHLSLRFSFGSISHRRRLGFHCSSGNFGFRSSGGRQLRIRGHSRSLAYQNLSCSQTLCNDRCDPSAFSFRGGGSHRLVPRHRNGCAIGFRNSGNQHLGR
mmetsp:Transcript_1057/g.2819  ORF Transcript_1057/g.2819 Transcript_1057/m.2819 type:complete len:213 (-) Transcript_1057:23-661(-)